MGEHIFVSAGDVSGDIHAANLAAAIKKLNPQCTITALGGERLRQVSDCFIENLVQLEAFGFLAPLKQYFRLRDIFNNKLRSSWHSQKPDKVILTDYYGFHIHVAHEAKRQGIPVYYYISPQVWATRPGRIRKLAESISKMLVILPFEENLYHNAGVDVSFVGHPLLDMVPQPATSVLQNKRPCIGLFPGSRPSIFKRHLPLIVAAAELIKKEIDADFKIFMPSQIQSKMPFEVVIDPNYRERINLTMAITTSGTVSLENALMGIPMIVFYKISWLNYLLARALIRIPYITMANILANEKIVPELIQSEATPEKIAHESLKYLKNDAYYETTKKRLIELRKLLGTSGASRRAAEIILNG